MRLRLLRFLTIGLILGLPTTAGAADSQGQPPNRIQIGSPDLLRNDEVTQLNPLTPLRSAIFNPQALPPPNCSLDLTISLDKADPANCNSSIEGEGARLILNGSSDQDDFYIRNFTAAGTNRTDTEVGTLLDDVLRPLVFYQIEYACDSNSILMVKNLAMNSVNIYLGNAVPCPVGACCDATGLCSDDQLEFECTGLYMGDGSDCISNPCPVTTGACCTATACLDNRTQADCLTMNGSYQGDGTTCASTVCTFTGACCTPTQCLNAQTETGCIAQNGSYQGDGSDCATSNCPFTGACCTATSCLNTQTQAACVAQNGVYGGHGTNCTSTPCTGACCRTTGCTPAQTQSSCTTTGGVYQGNNTACNPTSCPRTGACCSLTQPCQDGLTQAGCQATGGAYSGDFTTCTNSPCTGVCCTPSTPCAVATQSACTGGGGTYQGDTTVCATSPCPGACCVPGTGCVDGQTPAACTTLGGTSQGQNTTCLSDPCVGACCDDLGACNNVVLESTCVASGGIFAGEATSCSPNPCLGACCTETACFDGETDSSCNNGHAGSVVFLGSITRCGVDPCPPLGACCGPFGCQQKYQQDCIPPFENWAGVGPCTANVCDPFIPGACCDDANNTCADTTSIGCGFRFVPDGFCANNPCPGPGACCGVSFGCINNLTPVECANLVGSTTHLGTGTVCGADPCPPTGACCNPFGCEMRYEEDCRPPFENYAGDGIPCSAGACAGFEQGACCDDAANTCADGTLNSCNASGGRFVPDGLCANNPCPGPGACCGVAFGCINNLTPVDCANLVGSTTHLGTGTVCGVDPCPPTGACCNPFGCELRYEEDCVPPFETWQGNGTVCPAGC